MFVPLMNDITSKEITSTTRGNTPVFDFFRVTPHKVTHWAVMRNLLLSVDGANLILENSFSWEYLS